MWNKFEHFPSAKQQFMLIHSAQNKRLFGAPSHLLTKHLGWPMFCFPPPLSPFLIPEDGAGQAVGAAASDGKLAAWNADDIKSPVL